MTPPFSGQQLDPEEEKLLEQTADHWRQIWNDAPAQAITRIEEAAKQIITITATLQGFYVAAFVFGNLRTQIATLHSSVPNWLFLLLFFLSPVCWLVSLIYATWVFVPRVRPGVNFNEMSVSAWQKLKDAYGSIVEEKLRYLHYAHRWLVVSFGFILLAVILLVFL